MIKAAALIGKLLSPGTGGVGNFITPLNSSGNTCHRVRLTSGHLKRVPYCERNLLCSLTHVVASPLGGGGEGGLGDGGLGDGGGEEPPENVTVV